MCTDLVPVHNDIWRKLGLSSWRVFKAKHGAILKRRQGGREGGDPGTDQEVFLNAPAPSLQRHTSGAFLHTASVSLHRLYEFWMGVGPECCSGSRALEAGAVEPLTQWAARCDSRNNKGSNKPESLLRHWQHPSLCFPFYLTACPLITLGRGNSELLPLLTSRSTRSEAENLYSSTMTKLKYRISICGRC